MPVLIRKSDGGLIPLTKKLTTIGSSPSNDIKVEGDGVAAAHAHLLAEGDGFVVTGIDGTVSVNGKKRGKYRLAAGDVMTLGSVELTFAHEAPTAKLEKFTPLGDDRRPWLLQGYRRFHQFTQRCAEKHDVDELLAV